jgi:predicted site-specific integrase-resolvase
MNGRRPGLARLLRDREVSTMVVEHADRLARFGVEHLEVAFAPDRSSDRGGRAERDHRRSGR